MYVWELRWKGGGAKIDWVVGVLCMIMDWCTIGIGWVEWLWLLIWGYLDWVDEWEVLEYCYYRYYYGMGLLEVRRGYGGDTEGNTFDHIIDHVDKSGLSGNGTGMGTEIDGHMVTLYKLIE